MKKVNILGTEYKIHISNEDKRLENRYGFTDFTTKEIYISKLERDLENGCYLQEYQQKEVLRHEILHAFLYESGLDEQSNSESWATNEEMIDWFAIQSPKIIKTYKELGIL